MHFSFAAARYGIPQGTDQGETESGLAWRNGVLVHVGQGPLKWLLLDRSGRLLDSGSLRSGEALPVKGWDGILLWQEGDAAGSLQVISPH